MRALTYIDRLRLETSYPVPERLPGEALLRVRVAGICATDLELIRGYMDFEGVLGHEFVAEVVEADTPALVGRRVVGEINCPCRECPTCAEGLQNHCPGRTVLGILERDGAFADYTTLPEACLHQIPEELDERVAVFAEPLAAALRVLEQAPVDGETTVCVLGDGKLGMLVAQVLHTTGCRLTVLGHHEEKLDILRARGIAASLAEEAPGVRYQVVVDATGLPEGLGQALGLVAPRGTVVLKTTVAGETTLTLAPVVIDEVTVVGSRCGPLDKAVEWLAAGRVEVEPLIEAAYPLSEGIEAFGHAARRGARKILLTMDS
ncbi:MAG: alcohol dehydrogenase catalytic domain-containing protein [Nitrospinae bacterium]|nr:alcohol dehydrogenase catalytic domain-containing protein [Nitrospinota bacterium]MCH7768999.1 alcohol dehydrogenase catalytic domain-containing protein [Nitrospinota bacterium]